MSLLSSSDDIYSKRRALLARAYVESLTDLETDVNRPYHGAVDFARLESGARSRVVLSVPRPIRGRGIGCICCVSGWRPNRWRVAVSEERAGRRRLGQPPFHFQIPFEFVPSRLSPEEVQEPNHFSLEGNRRDKNPLRVRKLLRADLLCIISVCIFVYIHILGV